MFSETLHESHGSAKFVEDCETGLLEERKPDAEPKKGIISYKAIALTSVMSKWYVSCITLRPEKKRKNLRFRRNCTLVKSTE